MIYFPEGQVLRKGELHMNEKKGINKLTGKESLTQEELAQVAGGEMDESGYYTIKYDTTLYDLDLETIKQVLTAGTKIVAMFSFSKNGYIFVPRTDTKVLNGYVEADAINK